MKKLIALSTLAMLCSITSVAHAGFFDSLFGSKEQAAPVENTPAPEPTNPTTTTDSNSASTVANAVNIASGLIPALTGQLNVTEQQAEGGMGSLLGLAQTTLSSEEFNQLGTGIPGMEALLASAPTKSTTGATGLMSSIGGIAGSIGGIAQVTQQFEALGLSPEMIASFASIAVEYFSQEGADTGALLQKGLATVLN